MDDLRQLADDIASTLIDHGFKVHRYDAKNSDSIYLKVDYGACGSIRISDHADRGKYLYRWNIGPHIEPKSKPSGKRDRNFYAASDWVRMVQHIVADRERRQRKFDGFAYEVFKEKRRQEAKSASHGFWKYARVKEVKE